MGTNEKSPDGDYYQAVNRLRQFLSDSDSTEHSIFPNVRVQKKTNIDNKFLIVINIP